MCAWRGGRCMQSVGCVVARATSSRQRGCEAMNVKSHVSSTASKPTVVFRAPASSAARDDSERRGDGYYSDALLVRIARGRVSHAPTCLARARVALTCSLCCSV